MSTVLQPLVLLELLIMALIGVLAMCPEDAHITAKERIKWWLCVVGLFQIPMSIALFLYFFLPWYMGLNF